MDLSIAGQRIIRLALSIPRNGLWTAVADLDGETAPTGSVTLELGSRKWVGTIVAGGVVGGAVTVQIVGGAGGFGGLVPPRDYQNVPLRVPLGDALQSAGERLSPTSDQGILGTLLPRWTSRQSTLGQLVEGLLRDVDASWRILPDGSFFVGSEKWAEWVPSNPVALVSEDSLTGLATYGCDEPTVLPGMTYRGKRISHVQYYLEATNSRMELLTEKSSPQAGLSVLLQSILAILRKWLQPRLDYLAFYGCKVLEQTGETLSLLPDDPRLPEMSGVPIRGLPGVKVTVKAGARCMVGFDGGNPSQRYATSFEPDALETITVTSSGKLTLNSSAVEVGAGASAPIARYGDIVASMLPGLYVVCAAPGDPAPVLAIPVGGVEGMPTPPELYAAGTIIADSINISS